MTTHSSSKRNGSRRRKQIGSMLMIAMLTIALMACGTKPEAGAGASPASSARPSSKVVEPQKAVGTTAPAAGEQTVYPLTMKDASGTDVTFEKAPERITSIASSETETLYAIGAGNKIFGVDQYSDYPPEAKSKPQVGDMNTNMEALIATKPDVVIANYGIQKKVVEQLRALNIKVFAEDPKTLDGVIAKTEDYGKILNMQAGAKQVADKMREQKQMVVNAVKGAKPKKVYLEFSPGWTVGDGVFMSELIALAGGDNVAKGQNGYFQTDPEKIIKADPDVILYTVSTSPGMGDLLAEIQKRPGFDQISAMKNKQVFPVDDNKISRVGPRVTEALIEIAKAIHPDLVK